jgi:hypothetical protein
MGKSYWFKDWPTGKGQRGNFSNNKQDTFNPQEGFIGTRLQQGVPLLDRDWNESEDIRRYQDVMLRKYYLGDGTPDDGFRISALDPAINDFMISAGRFLMDGFEAVNEPAGANFILYSSQEGAPALTKVKTTTPQSTVTRIDTVYLDVWIEEVTGKDLPRLKNPDDVAMETCIRHRLKWSVRVDEGSLGHIPGEGHHFCDLAEITRNSARDTIGSSDIDDLRSGWQSLEAVQSRLRNAINSMLSDNMPSGPTMDLASSASLFPVNSSLSGVVEDNMGNMILFWFQDNSIWAKRYSASTRNWSVDIQIITGLLPMDESRPYINFFGDSRGDVWIFWQKQEGSASISSFWAKRYSTGTGIWTADIKLAAGTAISDVKTFEDSKGNIWLFWGAQEGTTNVFYNFWAKKYTAGSWSVDFLLTSGTGSKTFKNVFSDSSGAIWFFWQQFDFSSGIAPGIFSLLVNRYGEGNWSGVSALTSGITSRLYTNSFEDSRGDIWFFWQQPDAGTTVNNIWSKRFKSGSWAGDLQLTSGTSNKIYQNSFADARGDVWLIWLQQDTAPNVLARRFSANVWEKEVQITAGPNLKGDFLSLPGTKRDIWILYKQADASGIYNIVPQRYNFDTNQWEIKQFSPGAVDSKNNGINKIVPFSNGNLGIFWTRDNYYFSNMFSVFDGDWMGISQVTNSIKVNINRIFEKSNGEIWLLYGQPFRNLWCTRFVEGDWVKETRLISGAEMKVMTDIFEDSAGDTWIFWITFSNSQSVPRHIKSKKIYGSI